MTTVIDPNGTPIPVFNRSGLTIIDVDGGGDSGEPGEWTEVAIVSEHTIIRFNNDVSDYGMILTTGTEIGCVIEVYALNNYNSRISLPDGEEFINSADYVTDFGRGCYRFRKLTATQWGFEKFILS